MPKKLGIKGTFRGVDGTDPVRVHPRFLKLEQFDGKSEVFLLSELRDLGLPIQLVKQYALKRGILKTGRAPTPGRRFLKQCHYVDRDGLKEIIEVFYAKAGKWELDKGNRALVKGGWGVLPEKVK